MPKSYFKIENMITLDSLKKGSKIHFIGVCGVAMGQLAVSLSTKGFEVSGSDKEFYEPMGSFLKNSPIILKRGYDAANVPEDVDLVVIGNAISYGHPEVEIVEENNLPYTCFPRLLAETVIADNHSIVACGTHGKSTTSAMIASTLDKMGENPSYFIGGVTNELPTSLFSGTGNFSVVEGDEYDDVFFSKRPKFTHYKPATCIINAVEFDHADLYDSLEVINKEFSGLINSLPSSATALVCLDYKNLENLIKEWKETAKCKIITFGSNNNADYYITDRIQKGLEQSFSVMHKNEKAFSINLKIPAVYNARNALACILALKINNLDLTKAIEAIGKYQGVKKRQEVRFSSPDLTIIEDFAHHPTAVKSTIQAIKDAFPDRKLWAVFEPRSNTSRRKIFEQDYLEAFGNADKAILAKVISRSSMDAGKELLDVVELSDKITATGTESIAIDNEAETISKYITDNATEPSVVLIMSNGSFGGLVANLLDKVS